LDTKCKACDTLPSGIVGHRELFSESIDARNVVFSCVHCGTRWTRTYAAEGAYAWNELSTVSGVPSTRIGVMLP
jgi:hypothetical protein